jgi:hypothetical protein
LVAALGQTARSPNGDLATWAFAAPADTTLAGATIWRAGDAAGGNAFDATYQFQLAGPALEEPFDECTSLSGCTTSGDLGEPLAEANRVSLPKANLGPHLFASAKCGGVDIYKCPTTEHDANGYAAVIYLYAADLTLEQNTGPSIANISGELTSASSIAGTSDVAFTATDPASGVYEALFTLDGTVVQRTVLDSNGGRCKEVAGATDGLPAFLYVQPCVASISADVGFDTSALTNGTHHLIVSVIDAAGNAAPVLDRTVTIANRGGVGPPNGQGASAQATLTAAWKGPSAERLVRQFGATEAIAGRLTGPGGAPIAGAKIDLTAKPDYAGSKALTMPSPVTGPDGRFTVRLPRRLSSRSLRFAYRSQLGGGSPVATRTLTLAVRADVRLGVSPHTSSVGHGIRFSGSLAGGPVPKSGKALVLEARAPGGPWLEFDVVHSDRRGRFHAGYRFKFPGPADYQFRALSEQEADYPFATGASNVVSVHER